MRIVLCDDQVGHLKRMRSLTDEYFTIRQLPEGVEDFDALPAFNRDEGINKLDQRARDINEFITKLERDMLKWFKRQFRAMGFEGPVTNFNMGKSMRNILSRKGHGYFSAAPGRINASLQRSHFPFKG